MMKTTIFATIATAATLSFAVAAQAEDFPATPMNAGPPMMAPMMMPMMQPAPMAEGGMEKPMMTKKMTRKQKMMMKKKMMMEQGAQ